MIVEKNSRCVYFSFRSGSLGVYKELLADEILVFSFRIGTEYRYWNSFRAYEGVKARELWVVIPLDDKSEE